VLEIRDYFEFKDSRDEFPADFPTHPAVSRMHVKFDINNNCAHIQALI
jgi:hypothetical protein